jgi:Holliday junction resolvasome RuvABC endonuclease subunit
MIGIGLDASTTCIGYSIWENDKLIDYGKIKPTKNDLKWRDRVCNFIPQLHDIINKYKPTVVKIEDIPLINKQMITLVQLGCVQGMILGLFNSNDILVEFVNVNTWRKDVDLFDGTKKGKERDILKQHSIEKANKLFNLNLNCILTKSGNYNANKSDDDIADAILIYASTLDKYKIKRKFKI